MEVDSEEEDGCLLDFKDGVSLMDITCLGTFVLLLVGPAPKFVGKTVFALIEILPLPCHLLFQCRLLNLIDIADAMLHQKNGFRNACSTQHDPYSVHYAMIISAFLIYCLLLY